ncbi:hypothetical protein PMI04_008205 [Sphingobium sp. AP49]|uniref:hypothetical protein n=1 Tax=Sphingobium sp. AP49 TaxID=1144307 RepID=UPI00026ED19E|nr:hypothetical protein [Sphingobium sp. AP49]WHO40563.1 hypothetical protein PMI04_008205 [Sphingobium sp. AP49]
MSKTDDSAPKGAEPQASSTETVPDLATAARKSASKGVWMGTAVGIGSAAIVAALLYTSKKRG